MMECARLSSNSSNNLIGCSPASNQWSTHFWKLGLRPGAIIFPNALKQLKNKPGIHSIESFLIMTLSQLDSEILPSFLRHVTVNKCLDPSPLGSSIFQNSDFRVPLFCYLSPRYIPGSITVPNLAAQMLSFHFTGACSIGSNIFKKVQINVICLCLPVKLITGGEYTRMFL